MAMKIDEFIKLLGKRESDKQRKKLDALSGEEFDSLATQVGEDGDTALIVAGRFGHKEIVKRLLSVEGVDVNRASEYGRTALIWAAYNGHKEIVKRLLSVEGVDVNHIDRNDGGTALKYAAGLGHKEIVESLLSVEGVDVNHVYKSGHTALMVAALNGHKEIVESLLSVEGVDVNHASESGSTALSIAASWNWNREIVAVVAFAGFKQSMREGDLKTAKQQLENFYTGKSKVRKEKNIKILKLYRALLEKTKPDWAAVVNLSEIDDVVLKLTKKDTEVNQSLHVLIGKRLFQDATKEGVDRKNQIEGLEEALARVY